MEEFYLSGDELVGRGRIRPTQEGGEQIPEAGPQGLHLLLPRGVQLPGILFCKGRLPVPRPGMLLCVVGGLHRRQQATVGSPISEYPWEPTKSLT